MNLHEYQAKHLLAQYGLPIPLGYVCNTIKEIECVIIKLGNSPWIVKCQVHAGGRSKAGGIKVVNNYKEVHYFIKKWLGKRLITSQTDNRGQPVNQILIEKVINISKEFYLGVIIDFTICKIIFMASTQGGIEIEKAVGQNSEIIHKVTIDLLTGPMPYQARELAFKLGLIGKQIEQFIKIFIGLVTIFLKCDLILIEINPLVITKQGDLICLDSKFSVDSNALYRQIELQKMRDIHQEDFREAYASEWKLNYVALDGNIGCIVNGAGLAMGIMDTIKLYGGNPANFLDIGGKITKKRMTASFKVILFNKNIDVILVSIFGGIVSCDLIADSIIDFVKEYSIKIPIIVYFEGNNAELGIQKLVGNFPNIIITTSLIDVIKKSVIAAKGKANSVNFN